MGSLIPGSFESQVKYAVIDAATSGNNEIIAAKQGSKFRIISCLLIASSDVLARFESGADGTAKTGQMDLTANSGFSLNENRSGWFETDKGESLNLELSGAVSVDGCLSYIEIEPNQITK